MTLRLLLFAWIALCGVGVAWAETPTALEPSGRAWLLHDASVGVESPRRGPFATEITKELGEVGGGVLVVGRGCVVVVATGSREHRVKLSAETTAAVVSIVEGDAQMSAWRVGAEGCAASLDGVVLFVGEASAYLDEAPWATWQSLRKGTRYAAR